MIRKITFRFAIGLGLLVLVSLFSGCGTKKATVDGPQEIDMKRVSENSEIATLGGGCFWCVEAVYERIDGILGVVSGYAGGDVPDPTYEQVSAGTTGHAEVVQVEFDPEKISYSEVLDLFWLAHDPTTPNRQGYDVGTQYRSIVLYHSDDQRKTAEESKRKLDESGTYPNKSVTEIEEAGVFYPAEGYHQDYYEKNPYAGYCRAVISPKLEKLGLDIESLFADKKE